MISDVSASHATGSLIRTFPVSVSRDSYCTCMCHGDLPRLFFVMLTFSRLCLLLISGYVDSSFSWTSLCPYVTWTIRLLPVPGLRYAQSSTRRFTSCSLTRLDVILVFYLYGLCASLYLYFPDSYIYWVGDGTIPIFNLLCNHPKGVTCEIPRTLLVLSSSLAKAIRFATLREFPSVLSLTGSEVQPTQCTSVRS